MLPQTQARKIYKLNTEDRKVVCVTNNTVSKYIKKSTVTDSETQEVQILEKSLHEIHRRPGTTHPVRDVSEGLAAKDQEIGFGLIPCFVLIFALNFFSFNYNLEIDNNK